jgi:hypothetical protein
VQGGLRGIVYTAKDIWNHARQTSKHNNCSLRFNQQRRKDLAQAHDAENIGFEDIADPGKVDVEGWHGVVDAGVVDEVIEAAAVEERGQGIEKVLDGGFGVDGQREGLDAVGGEGGEEGGVAGCCEDPEVVGVEG